MEWVDDVKDIEGYEWLEEAMANVEDVLEEMQELDGIMEIMNESPEYNMYGNEINWQNLEVDQEEEDYMFEQEYDMEYAEVELMNQFDNDYDFELDMMMEFEDQIAELEAEIELLEYTREIEEMALEPDFIDPDTDEDYGRDVEFGDYSDWDMANTTWRTTS